MTSCASGDVLADRARFHVACERAEAFLDRLPDGCVSLMPLDFPYYGVKDDAWDNAWPTPEAFIEWMGGILAKCRRVLAPNGSLYVFASPGMAWGVEGKVREHFSVLNRITWVKAEGTHRRQNEEACRSYFPQTEAVIFAEHSGVAPLATTLRAARVAAGLSTERLAAAIGRVSVSGRGTGLVGLWESYPAGVGSCLPSREEYEAAMRACGVATPLPYEDVTRPFTVSAEVPYTDVWTYPTVNTYPGKHPCEKPDDMARNIVRASSRSGDVVADVFCGSGKFLAAAVTEGRRAIGCDMDPHWAEQSRRRCEAALATGRIVRTSAPKADKDQMSLIAV